MKKSGEIIDTLAWKYRPYLPKGSTLDLEDLKQEGWIEYLNCINIYKEGNGCQFHTLLWSCVTNRFRVLTRSERRYRKYIHEDNGLLESRCPMDPEREVMVSQAKEKLLEMDEDFGKMIVEGVPDELLSLAKHRMRILRYGRGLGSVGGRIRYPKDLLESFFNINLDILSAAVYNII